MVDHQPHMAPQCGFLWQQRRTVYMHETLLNVGAQPMTSNTIEPREVLQPLVQVTTSDTFNNLSPFPQMVFKARLDRVLSNLV